MRLLSLLLGRLLVGVLILGAWLTFSGQAQGLVLVAAVIAVYVFLYRAQQPTPVEGNAPRNEAEYNARLIAHLTRDDGK